MTYHEKIRKKVYGAASTGGLKRKGLQPADMKIACQHHKNQNLEKNGTYVKDNGELRMPTNFLPNPTKFGHRMAQKPKRAIFGTCRPAVNMRAAFCYFWPLILKLSQVELLMHHSVLGV